MISSDVRLGKQNLSHVSSMKSNIDISLKLEKEEKISQEWYVKDFLLLYLDVSSSNQNVSQTCICKVICFPVGDLKMQLQYN